MGNPVHCNLCNRAVEPKRHIGVGTLILVLLTWGFWLIAIPFYKKRCTICRGDSLVPQDKVQKFGAEENNTASPTHNLNIQKRQTSPILIVLAVLVVVGIAGNIGASFTNSTQPNVSQNNKEQAITKVVATTPPPTATPSQKARKLKSHMDTVKVFNIMGHPTWVVHTNDKGKFKIEDKSIIFAWYWENHGCAPVAVDFNAKSKVIGWDEGKFCAPDADVLNPPMEYSCEQADATRSKLCFKEVS